MVDRSPKIDHFAIELHVHLIVVPDVDGPLLTRWVADT